MLYQRNLYLNELPQVVEQVGIEAPPMQHFIWLLLVHIGHSVLHGLIHFRDKGAQVVVLDQNLVGDFVSQQDKLFFSLRSLLLRLRFKLELLGIKDFKGCVKIVKIAFKFVRDA